MKEENQYNLSYQLREIINDLIELYKYRLNQLYPCVNYIIKNNIRDTKYIEEILEQLLNIYDELYSKDEPNIRTLKK